MDRFQILKGIEPPPLTAEERLEAEALQIFQDTIDTHSVEQELKNLLYLGNTDGQISDS